MSIRSACRVLKADPKMYRYKSRRSDQAALEKRIREICETRVRYGYRRVHVVLQREGWTINIKRTHRLYSILGLQLRNKTPKRRVRAKLRDDRRAATRTHEVWAMDFVHDQLACGTKIRVLTAIDTYSRYAMTVDPRLTYRGSDVVATLDGVCRQVAIHRLYALTRGASLSRAIWIYGHTSAASRWTSRGADAEHRFAMMQTGGQCVHRVVQRQAQIGVLERTLVHVSCRCAHKVRGLA